MVDSVTDHQEKGEKETGSLKRKTEYGTQLRIRPLCKMVDSASLSRLPQFGVVHANCSEAIFKTERMDSCWRRGLSQAGGRSKHEYQEKGKEKEKAHGISHLPRQQAILDYTDAILAVG